MTGKWRITPWVFVLVLSLVCLAIFLILQREPEYQGRTFAEWSIMLRTDRSAALPALRALGPGCLPRFVRQANTRDWRLPWKLRRWLPSSVLDRVEQHNRIQYNAMVNLALLARIGVNVRPAMIPLLRAGNQTVAYEATRLFRDLHSDELPDFFESFDRGNESLRLTWAALVGVSADAINHQLYTHFQLDPSPQVRRVAINQLSLNPTNRVWLLPLLQKALHDPSPQVQAQAAISLARKGESLDEVIKIAQSIVNLPDGYEAAFALAALGPAASNAIPQLIARLNSESVTRPLRETPSAAAALSAIGLPAVPALIGQLNGTNPLSRLSAALALRNINAAPPEVVPPLLECLNSNQTELKVVAALTLGGLGNKSPQVISALEKCLEHDDIYVRSDALRLLRKLNPTREWNGHGE